MNFFKIKHIAVKMDGMIVCQTTTGDEIAKTADGWVNCDYGTRMTPLFDNKTGDLVGFFDPEQITVEFEEE